MVTTSFAAVVLGAVLAPGAIASPTWHNDYAQAMSNAAAQNKPLAVFIGQGKSGYQQLVKGGIPSQATEMLAKQYVCVYVDTTTSTGQSLAGQFELSKGLVISTTDGNSQALWHKGDVTPSSLTTYLKQCCDGSKVVSTTQVRGVGVSAVVQAPVVRPVAPQSYPAAVPQYFQQPRMGFPGAPCLTGR